jgi:hypothetical protein
MSSILSWLFQLLLVCVPFATGLLAWQTSRKHRPDMLTADEDGPARRRHPPVLNGSYGIIQACLERLKTVQADYAVLERRYIRIEMELAACRKRHEGDDDAPPVKTPRRRSSSSTTTRSPQKRSRAAG